MQNLFDPEWIELRAGEWLHWVEGGGGGGEGEGVDSYMIQRLTHPRSVCATLWVRTLGTQVLYPVFFHWGSKLSRIQRRGNLFFKVEEIDFESYSYLFLLPLCSVFEPGLYKPCLTSICLPRSHCSSGLAGRAAGLCHLGNI